MIYAATRNELAEVRCQVDAEPPEVQFHWSLNSSALGVLNSPGSQFSFGNGVSSSSAHAYSNTPEAFAFTSNLTLAVARFMPRNRFGYGALACWAQNSVGVQTQPCIFNIVPTGKK